MMVLGMAILLGFTVFYVFDCIVRTFGAHHHHAGDYEDLNEITDLSLSEFLKNQEEKSMSMMSKGRKGGIRDRVKRWLKFNRNKKETDENEESDWFQLLRTGRAARWGPG